MKDTPSMLQYKSIKEKYPDCIIFFRMGDFYETFEDDAHIMGKVLDIVVTSRDKGENKTPMAGIPYHALMTYLPKVIAAGYKVAMCEQIEDPKKAKGIVKRDVVKIITPGTALDSEIQTPRESNYIMSLSLSKEKTDLIIGIAYIDITAGTFVLYESIDEKKLKEIIEKINPTEVVLSETLDFRYTEKYIKYSKLITNLFPHKSISYVSNGYFEKGEEYLKEHFQVVTLKGFVSEILNPSIKAAGALLKYIEDNQKEKAINIEKIEELNISLRMYLDSYTINNLELLSPLNMGLIVKSNKKNSLLEVIDETKTSMGARALKNILMYPLINRDEILSRLDTVEFLVNNFDLVAKSREILDDVYDIERINARISFISSSPKDFISLKISLLNYLKIIALFKDENLPSTLQAILVNKDVVDICNEIIFKIDKIIEDNGGEYMTNSNIIKSGVDSELDSLKDLLKNGKSWIKEFQENEIKRSGINSLKVKFNKVFGYYIEISNSHKEKVPADYIRKQTLVNAERYITPLLKEKEDLILNAQDKINEIESKIFSKFREQFLEYVISIKNIAKNISYYDVLLSFSYISKEYDYVRPTLSSDSIKRSIIIKDGRHPVLERNVEKMNYIPNDVYLDCFDSQILLITGPNMAGKSSVLRLTALITLMVQIGCFVPAREAELYLVDRIFSRVGARDNLASGESTFLVEMNETANILNNATKDSLIILDEIGRGTSTYDGVSIAYSIMEYIHEFIGAKTMFATHYHELIDLENVYKKIKNYNVEVKEEKQDIVFLRKLVRGGTDKSYGIHVAKIAGVPKEVLTRANKILKEYEKIKDEIKKADIPPLISLMNKDVKLVKGELESEYKKYYELVKEIILKKDINDLTPLEGLNTLNEINKLIESNT